MSAVQAGAGGDTPQPCGLLRALFPCGRLLATASLDGSAALLSPSSLAVIVVLCGHIDGVPDLSWSTESYYLCSASDDKTLCVWDIRPVLTAGGGADSGADRCIRVLKGHTNFVFSANYNPQTNTQIASGGFDFTVRIWDVKTGRCTRAIEAHSEPITSVHFIRDGSIIVSGSHDASCKIWDANPGGCWVPPPDIHLSPRNEDFHNQESSLVW